jgi:cobalt-zinc-cadmium efflux system outer membrane protein
VRAQFPWQINYQFEGEIRQAAAAVQRSEEMLRLTTQLAISDMLALDLKKDRSAERLALFETQIRAQARQVLQRAEAAYNRGATPLTDLLEARRTHLAVELDAVQARADASRAATEWVLRLEGIAK